MKNFFVHLILDKLDAKDMYASELFVHLYIRYEEIERKEKRFTRELHSVYSNRNRIIIEIKCGSIFYLIFIVFIT